MKPLIMLHGWGSRPSVFQPLLTALGDPPALCPALDGPAGDIAQWADDLADALPDSGLLVGWSLGAMLALSIAARHPGKVASLVLIAATPRFVAAPDWPHGLDADTVQAFRDGFLAAPQRIQRRFVALQALGDAQRTQTAQLLDAHAADPATQHAALGHGLRLLATTDLRTALPTPALPALLVHGRQDAVIPVSAAQWLAERWHACRTLFIDDCAHAPHLSRPDLLAGAIRPMLDTPQTQ